MLSCSTVWTYAVWGGDPVYPTINYIQDPNAETDFRGPDFHEPTPDMLDYLKEVDTSDSYVHFFSYIISILSQHIES